MEDKEQAHIELGKKGEELACIYLKQKGYDILQRNWSNKVEELDIIAMKDKMMVVVEVKTRSTSFFGEPETFVTKVKQTKLAKAAAMFLHQSKHTGELRFDVIAITIVNKKEHLLHIEDAFYPSLQRI